MVDPVELRELAEGVARRAGALLGGALGLVRAEVATKSTLTDMVTEMDRASEALIVEGLLGARPDDGMLGEEGTDVAGTSGVRWIVDPLDGTTNYLYELPGFTVSIAAELDGAVVAGVATKWSPTDRGTEMGRGSEALIVEGLLGGRPDDGMLGEEGTGVAGTSGVRWIVDPLDGTTNYLYELPGFNGSIAAELDGAVVAGVVLDVVRNELFAATLGGGATRDGEPISTSSADQLAAPLIATGFSYEADRRGARAEAAVNVLPEVRDIRRFGAAAVDLCSVACGRVDGYYERGLAPWDLAAGGLIASEAGAVRSEEHTSELQSLMRISYAVC